MLKIPIHLDLMRLLKKKRDNNGRRNFWKPLKNIFKKYFFCLLKKKRVINIIVRFTV